MQVIYPTTPAQYFHALRRQMKNNPRKPLIVMNPKSLLRHPHGDVAVDELTEGRFEPVLHDVATSDRREARDLHSGKVYYDLKQARDKASANVAIVRLEQFYPFPQPMLADALKRLPERDGDRLGAGRAAQHGRLAVPPRAPGSLLGREPEARTSDARRRRAGDRLAPPARGAAEGAGGEGVGDNTLRAAALWSACGLPPLWVACNGPLLPRYPKRRQAARTPKRCGAERPRRIIATSKWSVCPGCC